MTARVTRNGNTITVDSTELVVGDIIEIPTGDCIPADCIVITATDCTVSEAALTGESVDMTKEALTAESYADNPSPFLM